MNNTIEDFFNEINDLEQPKQKQTVWRECHDELTGYSYYWNTKTDEVTWTTPSEYKSVKEQRKEKMCQKKSELYVPPRAAPLLPSTSTKLPENSIKIYSISENSEKKTFRNKNNKVSVEEKKARKPYKKSSDSEDEKIELISSYGGESESEEEEPVKKVEINFSKKDEGDSTNVSDDDDVDILTKIQKRAKELKEMGGDVPPEVVKVFETKNPPEKPVQNITNKPASSFSLVAGYSDSEEEQDNEEVKAIFPLAPESPKVAHSTLFPITKPIDVNDFVQPASSENKAKSPTSDFDSKAFQRKRRIGVALVNTVKKKEEKSDEPLLETKGLGFKDGDVSAVERSTVYPGFKKGGVMFVKSDVLNATNEENGAESRVAEKEENGDVNRSDLEDVYMTLMGKLGFLSEGRPQVSPVQVLVIQAETLFTAMRDNGLKPTYLQRWLHDTHTDLRKLEKEAAPEGWLLQWDRSHNRYYYQNQATGESQWEYPQPDVSRCDEAMDISTTPPPAEPNILSPPLPPVIRSPTPPPPPIISRGEAGVAEGTLTEVPLPPETTKGAPVKFLNEGEPLPPGVDLPEMIVMNKSKENEAKPADPLFSALDSFYSDIASMENTNSCSPPQHEGKAAEESKVVSESTAEPPKKKKKTKVKLAPGLAMKKKGVSQLVEKWKSVQQHFND